METPLVFQELTPLLIEEIPASLTRLQINEPICCVKIYYFDTHAPFTYLELKTVTEKHRQKVLEKKAEKALEYLWSAGESCGDGPVAYVGGNEEATPKEIRKGFDRIYKLISRDDDGDEYMLLLREMLQSVAMELNSRDWRTQFSVTDDFLFLPADGSCFFAGEHNADYNHILSSVPPQRLELLRSKGLLGTGENWYHRPGYEYVDHSKAIRLLQDFERRVSAMPAREQVEFWIEQWDRVAADEDCELKQLAREGGLQLESLVSFSKDDFGKLKFKDLGVDVILPFLRLSNKWADHTRRDDPRQESIVERIVLNLLITVRVDLLRKKRKRDISDEEIENLLRQILEKSCRVCDEAPYWSLVPRHAALNLRDLFQEYPSPVEDENKLLNRDAYLGIPPCYRPRGKSRWNPFGRD